MLGKLLAVVCLGAVCAVCAAGGVVVPPPEKGESDPAGRRVQVTLVGGHDVIGELVADEANEIRVRVGSIVTTIQKREIERIITLRTPMERYRSLRAVIDDGDVTRLLALVEWMWANDLHEEALGELEHVLGLRANDPRATELKGLISKELALRDKAKGEKREGDDDPPGGRRRASALQPVDPRRFPLLGAEQINLVKVYEVDLDDPPRMTVEREAVERFFRRYSDSSVIPAQEEDREALIRQGPAAVLRLMFDLQARDSYPDVRVVGLPDSLRRFRDDVHSRWLINACASTRCHGGLGAGDFVLFNRSVNSEATVVTNFMILDKSGLSTGEPLIDYDTPERSGLLQMAMRRDRALTPHPEAPGWRPIFRSESDRGFERAAEWIREMFRPRPDYRIDYEPPTRAVLRSEKPDQTQPPDG